MIRVTVTTALLLAGMVLARAGEAGQSTTAPTETAAGRQSPVRLRRSAAAGAPGRSSRATPRAGPRSAPCGSRAAAARRPARRGGLRERAADLGLHPDGAAARARRPPRRPRSGCSSTTSTSTSSVRCWESQPERMVANEMRRDSTHICRRTTTSRSSSTPSTTGATASCSTSTPIGGRIDGQITNERQFNGDWNPVWDVEVGRFDGGWTVEVAIPFKSLRYRPGRAQIWGFNARRDQPLEERDRRTSTRDAGARRASRGIMQVSLAATLVGLEAPPGSKNLEIKPYAISNLTTDRTATPRISNDLGRRRRRRREVRHHAEPDGRLHLQHRLRAGRGRRAAGQPHALQPVLPGEARVLPREPGDVRLRRRRRPAARPATRRCCSTAGASASTRAARCRSTAAAA